MLLQFIILMYRRKNVPWLLGTIVLLLAYPGRIYVLGVGVGYMQHLRECDAFGRGAGGTASFDKRCLE